MTGATARYRWDRLTVSFWFAPALMSAGAVLLAWTMSAVDNVLPNEVLEGSHFVLSGTVGELRTALLGMATTVLATTGVVFTLLTLPLSTVAAQYGSRLLRLFLSDPTTQFVLGMFVATFSYCVAGALSIASESVHPDGPQLTATVGLYLMLATFASLILLVQHISTMLQAPNIAAAAGAELLEVINAEITGAVTRGDILSQAGGGLPDPVVEAESYPVCIMDTGYIQSVDPEIMLALASEKDLVIRLLRNPSRFVRPGHPVALIWPKSRVNDQVEAQMLRAFQIGNMRTPTQDLGYAINQLVEMAVRAMSPAINDPFTAMTCLDYIGEGLALFVRNKGRGSHYYDLDGRLRLVVEPISFAELLSGALDMLRHASCNNASVLLHMLEIIDLVGQETNSPEARQALLGHVRLIESESQVKF